MLMIKRAVKFYSRFKYRILNVFLTLMLLLAQILLYFDYVEEYYSYRLLVSSYVISIYSLLSINTKLPSKITRGVKSYVFWVFIPKIMSILSFVFRSLSDLIKTKLANKKDEEKVEEKNKLLEFIEAKVKEEFRQDRRRTYAEVNIEEEVYAKQGDYSYRNYEPDANKSTSALFNYYPQEQNRDDLSFLAEIERKKEVEGKEEETNYLQQKEEKSDMAERNFLISTFVNELRSSSSLRQIPQDTLDRWDIRSTDYIKDTLKLGLDEIRIWVSNIKSFVKQSLLPSNLEPHRVNINKINELLIGSLGLRLQTQLHYELNYLTLFETILTRFQKLSKLNKSVIVTEKSTNIQNPDLKVLDIFFADVELISFLIQKIDEKIEKIKEDKELQLKSHFGKDSSQPNFRESFYSNTHLYRSETKDFYDFSNSLNLNFQMFENDLKALKGLLIERLKINKRLFPASFENRIQSKKHYSLLMAYLVARIEELQQNDSEYLNNSGGSIGNEKWFPGLPTDSQIVSSLFFAYLDWLYEQMNSKKKRDFVVYYPLQPIPGEETLVLVQRSSECTEPYFLIFYKQDYIYCNTGNENFYHAAVIFLFQLLKHTFADLDKTSKVYAFLNAILEKKTHQFNHFRH